MPQVGSSLARVLPTSCFLVAIALPGLTAGASVRTDAASSMMHPVSYVCPMHADVTSPVPGVCPRCNMTLVAKGGARESAYRVDLDAVPPATAAGRPLRLHLTVRNRASGAVVRDFAVVHEKPYHLFVISRDLEHFEHVHPQQKEDGSWIAEVRPPQAGPYTIYSDFRPAGGTPQVIDVPLAIAGHAAHPPSSPARLVPDVSLTKTVSDLSFTLELPAGGLVAGRPEALTFRLADAKTGAAIRDLEPYLGAFGHSVILSDDATHFVHAHPGEHGGKRTAGGPTLMFETRLPEPGIYRVWTQVQRRGEVVTSVFTIAVAPAARSTDK